MHHWFISLLLLNRLSSTNTLEGLNDSFLQEKHCPVSGRSGKNLFYLQIQAQKESSIWKCRRCCLRSPSEDCFFFQFSNSCTDLVSNLQNLSKFPLFLDLHHFSSRIGDFLIQGTEIIALQVVHRFQLLRKTLTCIKCRISLLQIFFLTIDSLLF